MQHKANNNELLLQELSLCTHEVAEGKLSVVLLILYLHIIYGHTQHILYYNMCDVFQSDSNSVDDTTLTINTLLCMHNRVKQASTIRN